MMCSIHLVFRVLGSSKIIFVALLRVMAFLDTLILGNAAHNLDKVFTVTISGSFSANF